MAWATFFTDAAIVRLGHDHYFGKASVSLYRYLLCINYGRVQQLFFPQQNAIRIHHTRRESNASAMRGRALQALWVSACAVYCLGPVAQSMRIPHAPVFAPLQTELWKQGFDEQKDAAAPRLPTISLVESLPVGDFALPSVVPQTFDALYHRTQTAQTSIDLSAMYWCVSAIAVSRDVFSMSCSEANCVDTLMCAW